MLTTKFKEDAKVVASVIMWFNIIAVIVWGEMALVYWLLGGKIC